MNIEQYQRLTKQAVALIESEPDFIANLANLSSLLFMELEDLNWAGFYLTKGDELVLGPFQGKPACVRIPMGRAFVVQLQKQILLKEYTTFTNLKVISHVMLRVILKL